MALGESEVVDTATRLLKLRADEQPRLKRIADYVAGKPSSVYVPKGARQEYRWLLDRAKVNMLPLVVTVVAQSLYVDGYRPERSDENAAAWAYWQANRMDARQHGLHRAVLKYGTAYAIVLPGQLADQRMPVIKPRSPRRLTAYYVDPVDDEWPMYAVETKVENTRTGRQRIVQLYDDEARYTLTGSVRENAKLKVAEDWLEEHGLGVCPVVRYLSGDDLDGDECVLGEVEPLIEMQDQLNSTTFNLLMAQQYAAFRQRWVTGMVSVDKDGNPKAPFQAMVDRVWAAEDPDTKFGEFGQSDLTGYLKSIEETIRHIATVSQTPPHHLLGQIANISAESLNSARDGLNSKVAEHKSCFGESHEQMLRLAAHAAGDEDGWEDLAAQVVWRDTQSRSLQATVDALGKLTQMLDVPAQELWERIPGVTQQDVERWKAAARESDAIAQLNALLESQMGGPNGSGPEQLALEPAQEE